MFLKRKDKLFDPSEQQQANFTTFFFLLLEAHYQAQARATRGNPGRDPSPSAPAKGTASTGVTNLGEGGRFTQQASNKDLFNGKFRNEIK